MADTTGPDEPTGLVFDDKAAHAYLGCLCAGPRDVRDGHWTLVVVDADRRPVAIGYVGLVFDLESAPATAASDVLTRAGYEHAQSLDPVIKPWAASWQILTPGDRLPR